MTAGKISLLGLPWSQKYNRPLGGPLVLGERAVYAASTLPQAQEGPHGISLGVCEQQASSRLRLRRGQVGVMRRSLCKSYHSSSLKNARLI